MDDAPSKESLAPFGYAYQYPDGIRFDTAGRTINGNSPTRTIILYSKAQVEQMLRERGEAAEKLAEVLVSLRSFVKDIHDWMHEQRKVRNTLDERFMRTATVLADIDASVAAWRESEEQARLCICGNTRAMK